MNHQNIDMKVLAVMVDKYLKGFYHRLEKEIDFYKSRSSLTDAINRAVMAETSSGKRCRHQCRLSLADMKKSKLYLLETEKQIGACKTFEELYDLVSEAIGHVYKNAVLYVYDTAWKIGAKLKLEPEGLVYLQRGSLKGAEALGFGTDQKTIRPDEFPPPLQRLRPIHIENFLCLYKKQLLGCQDDEQPVRRC